MEELKMLLKKDLILQFIKLIKYFKFDLFSTASYRNKIMIFHKVLIFLILASTAQIIKTEEWFVTDFQSMFH
jgi:hypothetical protein